MRDIEQAISRYTSGDLRERLHAALRDAGKEPARLQPGDLAESDQFHSGGSKATEEVARAVGIGPGTRVLDVGSGLGGPARCFARLGAVVTGVDITEEFVLLARELNAACSMSDSITMLQAPAQDTSLPGGSFEVATMLHVGMNLANKPAVFAEIHRLLRPGGVFGVYDLMGTNELRYPMPWADDADASYVESAESYRRYLREAGFLIIEDKDRTAAELKSMGGAGTGQQAAPNPLDAPILLGTDAGVRMGNFAAAMRSGILAPRMLIAARSPKGVTTR